MEERKVQLFEGKRIRTVWKEDEQEWYLSVVDVVEALTGTDDPRRYWSDLKRRLKAEGGQPYEKIVQLKLLADDGKMRLTDVVDAEHTLLIIQQIRSQKTEQFKQWLAQFSKRDISDNQIVKKEAFTHENGRNIRIRLNSDFDEMISIIDRARENTFRMVNRELINLYWNIGMYVSNKVKNGEWGKSVVKEFSEHIQVKRPEIKGFSPQNIWRMKQLYETYKDNEKLSSLLRELSWTLNTKILGCKTDEEREFYMQLAISNNYSSRELERQVESHMFERTLISGEINKPLVSKNTGLTIFRDGYVLDFLDLPERHSEKDIRKAIVANMRDFILELGTDFTFVGEEYRIRVGNTDFYIDLLFYNRRLSCLVAVELKITDFKPEHMGQLEFYLEALDRKVKKPDENPSVGLIICAGKDEAVVEYSLSRSMSPALVAAYQLCLPDKSLLENRLRELRDLRGLEEQDGDDIG
ncbi:endonuclease NucS [Candidatus Methanoplasma termitum]|uniref:NucS protein n=1 Tax=Candidatus Methanoplasma termitum TaxID=1577791 RepID=A0A0A7LCE7_9ARCH|nr:PDDEXK nuclease domain-containing protein [Candidatus Methanoplasma termitum]AIZ56860.1 endonuclease NucS [Candidatus Methanoplasma termitum]